MDYFLDFSHCNPSFNFFFCVVCCLLIFHSWRSQSYRATECKMYWFINNWLELIIRWDQGRTYFEHTGWEKHCCTCLSPRNFDHYLSVSAQINFPLKKLTFVLIKDAKFDCFSANLNVSKFGFGFHFWKLYMLIVQKDWKYLDDTGKHIINRIEIAAWSLMVKVV